MGIAGSDALGMMAHPLECIPAEPFEDFLRRLKEILAERETEQIVVGMPRNMDGSFGPQALLVQDFVAVLKKISDRAGGDVGRTADQRGGGGAVARGGRERAGRQEKGGRLGGGDFFAGLSG